MRRQVTKSPVRKQTVRKRSDNAFLVLEEAEFENDEYDNEYNYEKEEIDEDIRVIMKDFEKIATNFSS